MEAAGVVLTFDAETRARAAVDAVHGLTPRCGACPAATPVDQGLRGRLLLLVAHDVHVRDWLISHVVTHDNFDVLVDALVRTALTAPVEYRAPIAATAAALLAAQGTDPVAFWAMVRLSENESLTGLVRDSLRLSVPAEQVRGTFADALPLVQERITARS